MCECNAQSDSVLIGTRSSQKATENQSKSSRKPIEKQYKNSRTTNQKQPQTGMSLLVQPGLPRSAHHHGRGAGQQFQSILRRHPLRTRTDPPPLTRARTHRRTAPHESAALPPMVPHRRLQQFLTGTRPYHWWCDDCCFSRCFTQHCFTRCFTQHCVTRCFTQHCFTRHAPRHVPRLLR